MPLLKHITLPHFHFALWEIEETEEKLLALLPSSLRQHYDQQLQTLKHNRRRTEWLAARVITHYCMCITTPISYHENGCPFLEGCTLHISLSHSRNRVAVAIAEHPVGVDIEFITERAYRLRSRFLTPEEQVKMSFAPNNTDETTGCVWAWSAKEAAFKYFSQTKPLKLLTDICLTEVKGNIITLQSMHEDVCSTAVFTHDGFAIAVTLNKDATTTCENLLRAFQ